MDKKSNRRSGDEYKKKTPEIGLKLNYRMLPKNNRSILLLCDLDHKITINKKKGIKNNFFLIRNPDQNIASYFSRRKDR